MMDEYMNPKSIITKINHNFVIEWQIMVNRNSDKQPVNPNEIEQLNTRGYGNLFLQVLFYKKGYKEFLNEFNDIIR